MQAVASAAKARNSYQSASNTYKKLKAAGDAVDPAFLQKVLQNKNSAETASEGAQQWANTAKILDECAMRMALDAKGSVDADDAILYDYFATICAKLATGVATNAATDANKASASATAAKSAPNPPIESLSQSLEFTLTVGLTASPSWSLIFWKGPASTGNLLNLNGIRMHTLDIALGPPGAGGAKTGQAQQNAISNLGFIKVQNAVNNLTLGQ